MVFVWVPSHVGIACNAYADGDAVATAYLGKDVTEDASKVVRDAVRTRLCMYTVRREAAEDPEKREIVDRRTYTARRRTARRTARGGGGGGGGGGATDCAAARPRARRSAPPPRAIARTSASASSSSSSASSSSARPAVHAPPSRLSERCLLVPSGPTVWLG